MQSTLPCILEVLFGCLSLKTLFVVIDLCLGGRLMSSHVFFIFIFMIELIIDCIVVCQWGYVML